jgi:hypothetical protein
LLGYLYLLGTGLAIGLVPFAVYLLYIGSLHRRRRPMLLSGTTDAAILFAGIGGFLILGGPIFVSLLDSGLREFWTDGNLHELQRKIQVRPLAYSLYCVSYSCFLLSMILATLLSRSNLDVIYNIDQAQMQNAISLACQRLEASSLPINDISADRQILASSLSGAEQGDVELDVIDSQRTATIRWNGDYQLGKRFIRELDHALRDQLCDDSPVAKWFTLGAATILSFIIGVILLSVFLL